MTVTTIYQISITPYGETSVPGFHIAPGALEKECNKKALEMGIGDRGTKCYAGYSYGIRPGLCFVLVVQDSVGYIFNMDRPKGSRIVTHGRHDGGKIIFKGVTSYIVYSHSPNFLERTALISFDGEMTQEILSCATMP